MVAGKRKFVIIGCLSITLIYILYNIFFVYASYYNQIPRHVRHINKLLSTLIVYGIGWYSLKKYGIKWLSGLWKIIYITVLILLVSIGVYDWSLGPAPSQVRDIAKTFHECLISPILYAAFVIVSSMLRKIGGNEIVSDKKTVQS